MSLMWDLRTRLWGLVYDRVCDGACGEVLEAVRSGFNKPLEPQWISLFRGVCAEAKASVADE